eukprot:TRINITY_DN13856_c0_g1_i3.p1 TRINITY_DN13856_c0_g1~~TRINITY_DN13856_c0_g1_i3.p1  ORF type:complete len:228 (-),score=76.94 TRINITY_DN13856_c0_g1_i3:38-721(-)
MGMTCCNPQNTNENEMLNKDCIQKPYNDCAEPGTNGGTSDYFQIPVQWICTCDGNDSPIAVEQFRFSPELCRFEGDGSDEHGKFTAVGTIAQNGNVMIKLLYEEAALLWKRFEGKFEENVIRGGWKSDDSSEGEFTLELITTVWHNGHSFVALKGLSEFVGVARFGYGFGTVSGTPMGEDSVRLNVLFGDGKTGCFHFLLTEDCIKGQVISPIGEEDLELVLRNEFD